MKKLVALAVLALALAGCTYSEGDRAGKVFKLSKKGYVFKTWEGEMVIGDTGIMMGRNVWRFSVTDDNIAKQIQDAKDSDRVISLTYKQVYPRWTTLTETTYHVTGVKVK